MLIPLQTVFFFFFLLLQFIKNLCKKWRLLQSHMVLCRGWPTFIPTIWSTGEFLLLCLIRGFCKHYISYIPLKHTCSLSLSGTWRQVIFCWLSLGWSNWPTSALPPSPHPPTPLWERHIGKWKLKELFACFLNIEMTKMLTLWRVASRAWNGIDSWIPAGIFKCIAAVISSGFVHHLLLFWCYLCRWETT